MHVVNILSSCIPMAYHGYEPINTAPKPRLSTGQSTFASLCLVKLKTKTSSKAS